MVDVAEEEVVNRAIPVASELVPGRAIPPVSVEAAVGEHRQFRKDVELCEIEVSISGVDKHYRESQVGTRFTYTEKLEGEGSHSQYTPKLHTKREDIPS